MTDMTRSSAIVEGPRDIRLIWQETLDCDQSNYSSRTVL